jgi:hypothetical protein
MAAMISRRIQEIGQRIPLTDGMVGSPGEQRSCRGTTQSAADHEWPGPGMQEYAFTPTPICSREEETAEDIQHTEFFRSSVIVGPDRRQFLQWQQPRQSGRFG